MKNVVLDFNLIIKAESDNTFKTGIYYVQYNVIKQLIENYSDRFNFFAFSYFDKKTFYNIINKNLPEFKNIKYLDMFSITEKIDNFLKVKIIDLRKQKKSSKNPFAKFGLLCGTILLKFLKLCIPNFKDKKVLKQIDVYQSFFDDIPDKIGKSSNIKKFIFVYDIIPFTNPEYSANKEKDRAKIKANFGDKINQIPDDAIVFTDSEYAKSEILRYFPKFKPENIVVHLLAADTKKYYKLDNIDEDKRNEVLKKYNIPTDKKYILSLCSLNKRKNLAFLVESFVDFLHKNPQINDLNLVLAGPNGWLMDEMFNSISNADKYKDRIILAGFIDDKDVNMIYNSSFMFICPSLAEGFGLPVLEAMQCGIPVISANTTSLPEVYGNAAIGINPTDMEDLEKAIKKVYSDDTTRSRLIKEGLQRSKGFSWEKTVDNIANEY